MPVDYETEDQHLAVPRPATEPRPAEWRHAPGVHALDVGPAHELGAVHRTRLRSSASGPLAPRRGGRTESQEQSATAAACHGHGSGTRGATWQRWLTSMKSRHRYGS